MDGAGYWELHGVSTRYKGRAPPSARMDHPIAINKATHRVLWLNCSSDGKSCASVAGERPAFDTSEGTSGTRGMGGDSQAKNPEPIGLGRNLDKWNSAQSQ